LTLPPVFHLFDDGLHEDQAADDGVYGGMIATSVAGLHGFAIRASRNGGTYSFSREITKTTLVVQGNSWFDEYLPLAAQDTDGDGLYNELPYSLRITTEQGGRYSVSAELQTEGVVVDRAQMTLNLVPGTSGVILAFDGRQIYSRGLDGPFSLGNLILSDLQSDLVAIMQKVEDAGAASPPYSYLEFQRDAIVLTGDNVENAVDANGDGAFDELRVRIGVNVVIQGEYLMSATLENNCGEEVGFVQREVGLVAGINNIEFVFPGRAIGRASVDGPFRLVHFGISSLMLADNVSLSRELVLTTAPYPVRNFSHYRVPVDCNQNGRPDRCDIYSGLAVDYNGNGILDSCEPGTMSLEVAGGCFNQDITVELWIRNLPSPATGFQAFIGFDQDLVAFRPDLSSYEPSPFGSHIQTLSTAEQQPGHLRLDGFVQPSTPPNLGTDQDTRLAVLTFAVLGECDSTSFGFYEDTGFASRLSFLGERLEVGLTGSAIVGVASAAGLDSAPPVISCPPAFLMGCLQDPAPSQSGTATATDSCDSAPRVSFSDVPVASPCSAQRQIRRTWLARDACGNESNCVQMLTSLDNTAPEFVAVPGIISIPSEAGRCGATVEYFEPTVLDACDPAPAVACDPPSGSAFPVGVTNVTCSATDLCGNSNSRQFTVEVRPVNLVSIGIDLPGVHRPGTRCIRATAGDCDDAIEQEVQFVDYDSDDLNANGLMDATELGSRMASTPIGSEGFVEIPCGDWSSICLKDPARTIAEVVPVWITGAVYSAETSIPLSSGDADDDGDVDMEDVASLLATFGTSVTAPCPDDGIQRPDFSGNGVVGAEDYTFIATNWMADQPCPCDSRGSPVRGDIAPIRIAVNRLKGPGKERADFNRDGWVDHLDVRLLEERYGLGDRLSRRIQEKSKVEHSRQGRRGGE